MVSPLDSKTQDSAPLWDIVRLPAERKERHGKPQTDSEVTQDTDAHISLAKASPCQSLMTMGQESVTHPSGWAANTLNSNTQCTIAQSSPGAEALGRSFHLSGPLKMVTERIQRNNGM